MDQNRNMEVDAKVALITGFSLFSYTWIHIFTQNPLLV